MLRKTLRHLEHRYEREAQKQRVTSKEQTRNQEVLRQLCQEALICSGSSRFAQEEPGSRSVRCHESVFEGGSTQDLGSPETTGERLMYSSATTIQTCAKVQRKKRILTNSCCSCNIQAHYKAAGQRVRHEDKSCQDDQIRSRRTSCASDG